MKIRLTESQLKNIIKATINEADEFARNIPDAIKPKFLKKVASENPDLDPNGFFWIGGTLKHNGKKRPKAVPKPKIVRQNGESTDEFLERVAQTNEKVRNMVQREKGHMFRNIENILERFGVDTTDYLSYEVSETGTVRIINNNDGDNSFEPNQYQDRHGDKIGDYQVHLGSQNCPVVKNLVAFAFPDLVPQPFDISQFGRISSLPYVVVHKDGNKANNAADNLEWRPKRQKL